jgi:hypothetical protein
MGLFRMSEFIHVRSTLHFLISDKGRSEAFRGEILVPDV